MELIMTFTILLSILAASAAAGAYYYAARQVTKDLESTMDLPEPEFTDPVPGLVQQDSESEPVSEQKPTKPARAKKAPKLPTAQELEKMTKARIAELALERGLALDLKLTKTQMIAELLAYKPTKAKKQ